jgi:hypothetical protein
MKKILTAGFLAITVLLPNITFAFESQRQHVTLTSPAPYQYIEKGTRVAVKWDYSGVNKVNLYYASRDGGQTQLIQYGVPSNARMFSWAVPSYISDGEYSIIIENVGATVKDVRQVKIFGRTTIIEPNVQPSYPVTSYWTSRMVTVRNPNGGEYFRYNQPFSIGWDHTNLGSEPLDIFLGVTNGGFGIAKWIPIGTSVPGNWNQFGWVPTQEFIENIKLSSNPYFQIRIVAKNYPLVQDTSDGLFSIGW